MKFICDQMLGRLGKWLRAAGYDTIIIDKSMPDLEILEMALASKRYLLTRDRLFSEIESGKDCVIYLATNSLEEWVSKLKERLEINWLHAPFTRCLQCNAPLQVELLSGTFCPVCNRHYWEGSHTERMLATLTHWNSST